MITANQWYNIAKTANAGSKTGIRVEIGGYYVLLVVEVDFGTVVITAVESNINSNEVKVGARIRYNNGAWFADVRISKAQDGTLSASLYNNTGWSTVAISTSTPGTTVCLINDIMSQIPTGTGESLFEIINVGTPEEPQYAVAPKAYNGQQPGIVSKTFITFGGFGNQDPEETAKYTLERLNDVLLTTPAGGDVLTYDETKKLWVNQPAQAGLDEQALALYLYQNNYAKHDDVKEAINTALNYLGLTLKSYTQEEETRHYLESTYDFVTLGAISFGGFGQSSGGGGGIAEVTYDMVIGALGYTPYNSTNPNNFITADDLNNRINDLVNGAPAAYDTLKEIADVLAGNVNSIGDILTALGNKADKATTLAGYGITDALSSTTKYALGDDVGGNAVNANKLGNQLPAYYATADDLTGVSNRVKTLEDVIGIDANGDVYIKKNGETARNLYIYGAISFGGIGSGGSGGGVTALSALTDVALGTLIDGQSLVWDGSKGAWVNKAVSGGTQDLSSYLTKYEAANTYLPLSGGTLTNSLAVSAGTISSTRTSTRRAVFYKNASETIDAGTYIVDVSDSGDAVLKLSYNDLTWKNNTVIHSGNYSSYALPLSGGRMANNAGISWSNNIHSWDDAVDGFECISVLSENLGYWSGFSYKGYYGLQMRAYGGNTDYIQVRGFNHDNWGTWRDIIHSGNIGSQSVSYASSAGNADVIATTYANQSINIGAESRVRLISLTASNSTDLGAPEQYVSGLSVMSNYVGWQLVSGGSQWRNDDFFIRKLADNSAYLSWKQLAFIDSNVASATKLQTARTIWGQSFDGSGDVWGAITVKANAGFYHLDSNGGYLAYVGGDSSFRGVHLYNFGYGNSIRLYNDGRVAIPEGDILIGTTTDWGFRFASNAISGDKVSGYLGSGGGAFFGNIDEGYGTAIWTQGNGNGYIQQGRSNGAAVSYHLCLQPLGGNVLIGTATDNGGKLQVEGTIKSVGGSNGSMIALLASGHVRIYAKTAGDTAAGVKFYTNDGSTLLGTPAGVFGANTGVKRYYYGGDYNTASMYIFANGNVSIGGPITDMGAKLYVNGNLVATGAITFGSDARYKHRLDDVSISLEDIANAPLFNYVWTDREDKKVHLGTTAQYWSNTAFKNAVVPTTDEKLWTMSYSEITMGNTIVLARELLPIKREVSKIVKLESRVSKLERILREHNINFD